jgi:hypothetical protein
MDKERGGGKKGAEERKGGRRKEREGGGRRKERGRKETFTGKQALFSSHSALFSIRHCFHFIIMSLFCIFFHLCGVVNIYLRCRGLRIERSLEIGDECG